MKKLVSVLLSLLMILWVGCSKEEPVEFSVEKQPKQEDKFKETEELGESSELNQVLMDNEYVTLTLQKIFKDESYLDGPAIQLYVNIVNKGTKNIYVDVEDASLRDEMISIGVGLTHIKPGCKASEQWTLYDNNSNFIKVNLKDITNLSFRIEIVDAEEGNVIISEDVVISAVENVQTETVTIDKLEQANEFAKEVGLEGTPEWEELTDEEKVQAYENFITEMEKSMMEEFE